jgi:hypothetical protein
MAKIKAQGEKLSIGAAISKTQVDAIKAAANDTAAIALYDDATPFVVIPNIETRGDFGLTQNIITGTDINTGLVEKEVTTRDPGSMQMTCFFDSGDAVVNTIKNAADAGFTHVFKLVHNDKGPVSPSTATIWWFAGIVSGFTLKGVNVDGWLMYDTTIAIVTEPVMVART